MLIKDFLDVMESIAPRELALDYDNPGLIVGTERTEITKVLIALDCTEEVADEAKALGCDLVVTHHPLLFRAVKRISPFDPLSAPVYRLIKNGVGMFAAHTNLDSAEGGVNTELCRLLGIKNEKPVPPENLARVGELDESIGFSALAERVEKTLGTTVRLAGQDRPVRRIMVVGGAGGSEYGLAKEAGADVLITGECKHNEAIEAASIGVNVIAAGHYETESVVLLPLKGRLSELTNGVEYVISKAGNPLRTL